VGKVEEDDDMELKEEHELVRRAAIVGRKMNQPLYHFQAILYFRLLNGG